MNDSVPFAAGLAAGIILVASSAIFIPSLPVAGRSRVLPADDSQCTYLLNNSLASSMELKERTWISVAVY